MTYESPLRPVIVCTKSHEAIFGYTTNTSGKKINLTEARMVILSDYLNEVMKLAKTGPTEFGNISVSANIEVRKIIAVLEVTQDARAKWESA